MINKIIVSVLISFTVAVVLAMIVMFVLPTPSENRGESGREVAIIGDTQASGSELIGQSIENYPDQGLVNEQGEPVSFEALPNKPVLMSFIYTRCPMPKMCPLITRKMEDVQQKMRVVQDQIGGNGSGGNPVQFVSVTFDPEYDTPQVLKDCGQAYDIDLTSWDFWTGKPDTIRKLTNKLNINARKTGKTTIMHNMRTYVLDKNRVVQAAYRGSQWNPKKVTQRLKEIVQ